MKVALVTLFPEVIGSLVDYGITARAVRAGLIEIACFNPRDHALDRHRTVDDRPYGGGPGMVMRPEPLVAAIAAARAWTRDARVLYLSPQGQVLRHPAVVAMAAAGRDLILVAGRYEGIDERVIALEVDEEWSIGDYVLSGGELPALVLLDALIRQLPGALGDAESAAQDSFAAGVLDCPHYTRPPEFRGLAVPEVLLSGDHAAIARWRREQALARTRARRPDLLGEAGCE
ncbi:MAG: tRNA (guanosine(37)-N1)-methyltransferase TrmD [Pseudomonadales bacterium]|nr:tRNA (guanosine(37)-N1)-methyltransferase TrmD [Pseudomonadales bacterium]